MVGGFCASIAARLMMARMEASEAPLLEVFTRKGGNWNERSRLRIVLSKER